jgi:hypothetical protein
MKTAHVVTRVTIDPPTTETPGIAMSLVPGFPERVHYINHEECEAAFVQGGRVIEDGALTVIANRGRQRGAGDALRGELPDVTKGESDG